MIVAVTGGSGYLAQRIIDYLLEKKIRVIVISRKKLRFPKYKNIESLLIDWNKNYPIKIQADVLIHTLRTNKLSKSFNKNNLTYQNKIINRITQICLDNNIKKIFYISSIHIYKNFNKSTKENNKSNFSFENSYSKEKILFENHLLNNKKLKDVNINILRLANCFGYPGKYSGDCWNLFINHICKKIFLDKKIIIKNNIHTHRNFIPISLVNDVIFKLLNSNKKKNIIINIANDKSISLKKITNIILTIIKNKYKIKPKLIHRNITPIKHRMNIDNTLIKKMRLNIDGKFKDELEQLIDYCYLNFNK